MICPFCRTSFSWRRFSRDSETEEGIEIGLSEDHGREVVQIHGEFRRRRSWLLFRFVSLLVVKSWAKAFSFVMSFPCLRISARISCDRGTSVELSMHCTYLSWDYHTDEWSHHLIACCWLYGVLCLASAIFHDCTALKSAIPPSLGFGSCFVCHCLQTPLVIKPQHFWCTLPYVRALRVSR